MDDEEPVRQAVRSLLEQEGYSVETAASGEEGVEAVRRTLFHLVLLDLKMEGMGGLEALRQMKAHDPGVPVLVFTGHASVESAKEAMRSGAADYLPKPVTPTKLLELLPKTLRPSPPGSSGTVLVVDDDPMALQSVLALLGSADIRAEGFSRADQALLQAVRGEGQVLLTDLKLGDGDGLHLLARIREQRPDMPTILFTGHPSVETTVEALRLGAVDYLSKPVPPDQLLETVRQALERSRAAHLPKGLRPGRAYLSGDPARARELFGAVAAQGVPGLCISRSPPEEAPGRGAVTHYRLGGSDGSAAPSVADPVQMADVIERFCNRGKGITLIEGLEYLSIQFGFETTYRTLCALRDLAASTGSILLVAYPASAFTDREHSLLARELEPLEEDGKPELWEARARNLTGDERVLHDILRGSRGRKHQADLVLATGFSAARMSRILDRMERKGLLRRQRDGMGNLVVLA